MKNGFALNILILVFSISIFGSETGDYLTSEDDILDALAREEISFTQYYDILELFRDKISVFDDDLERLQVIPGVDRRWIGAVREAAGKAGPYASKEDFIRWFSYNYDRISGFVIFEKTMGAARGSIKFYTHGRWVEEEVPTTNATLIFASEWIKLEARIIAEEEGVRCRRRAARIEALAGEWTFGSFSKGFGNGLILGKAFHVPGAMRENSPTKSIVMPKDNLFNGLRYEGSFGKIGAGMIFSRVVYDSIVVGGIGAKLEYSPTENLRIGGVFANADAARKPVQSTFRQNSGSIFTVAEISGTKLLAEAGFSEDDELGIDLSLLTKMEKARALMGFWSYSDGFHPLHGKGESDYRETDIELGTSGVVQDCRQAGETGAEIKISAPLSDFLSIDIDQSGWRTPINTDWGILSETKLYYKKSGGKRLSGELSWEKRTLTTGIRTKETIRLTGDWPLAEDLFGSAYFRMRWTKANESITKSLSTYAEIKSEHFSPLEMQFRIRRSKTDLKNPDNGYWELRFRDGIRSGSLLWNAEARYAIYDKPDKENLLEFRITCGWTWR